MGTWTYDPAETTDRDKVRGLVGDVIETRQLVFNETIDARLTDVPANINEAAARVADGIAARFAADVNFSNGALSVQAAERAKAFKALAKDLRARTAQQAMTVAVISVGGVTVQQRQDVDADNTVVKPPFQMGQDDYPRSEVDRNFDPYFRRP